MALLAAVAGQAATALENGRLYRQLHDEGRRARAAARVQRERPRVARRWPRRARISTTASSGGTARSNSCTACRARSADRPSARRTCSSTRFVEALVRGAARAPRRRDALPRAARLAPRPPTSRCCVNVATVPLRTHVGARHPRRPGRSSSSRTSARACSSRSSCRCRRRWRRSVCSRPASRTR